MPQPDLSRTPDRDLAVAVRHLVTQGRLTAREVLAATDRARQIVDLERQLAALRGNGALAGAGGKPKRHITRTPELIRARKVQGQYLGRLKKLKGRDRQRVKTLAKKDSVAAAVRLADKILAGR